jgi:sarcosine oxidase subunit gamma
VRLSLRARPDAVGALSAALGVALPTRPKTSSRNGDRHALWLGPDEWLVLELGTLDPLAALASASVLHSAVDVSHRNTAVIVSGPMAAAVINAGCPLDLAGSAFPVGACTRTILGKAEIVLYRTGAETFRVECWRSFSDYVMTYLSDAARGV